MAQMREAAADTFKATLLPALAPLVVAILATCPLSSPISFSWEVSVSRLLSTAADSVLISPLKPEMSSRNSRLIPCRLDLIRGSSPRPRSAERNLVSWSRRVVRFSRSRSPGSHMSYTVSQYGRKINDLSYSGKPLACSWIGGGIAPSRSTIEVRL